MEMMVCYKRFWTGVCHRRDSILLLKGQILWEHPYTLKLISQLYVSLKKSNEVVCIQVCWILKCIVSEVLLLYRKHLKYIRNQLAYMIHTWPGRGTSGSLKEIRIGWVSCSVGRWNRLNEPCVLCHNLLWQLELFWCFNEMLFLMLMTGNTWCSEVALFLVSSLPL